MSEFYILVWKNFREGAGTPFHAALPPEELNCVNMCACVLNTVNGNRRKL